MIKSEGNVFDDQGRSVGRAHVDIRLPRAAATTSERRTAEREGTGRRMGTIRFQSQGLLGPPAALIGKALTMRLDDGRTLEFMLFDSRNIQVLRITD